LKIESNFQITRAGLNFFEKKEKMQKSFVCGNNILKKNIITQNYSVFIQCIFFSKKICFRFFPKNEKGKIM
jgi:hypothetical protein